MDFMNRYFSKISNKLPRHIEPANNNNRGPELLQEESII